MHFKVFFRIFLHFSRRNGNYTNTNDVCKKNRKNHHINGSKKNYTTHNFTPAFFFFFASNRIKKLNLVFFCICAFGFQSGRRGEFIYMNFPSFLASPFTKQRKTTRDVLFRRCNEIKIEESFAWFKY